MNPFLRYLAFLLAAAFPTPALVAVLGFGMAAQAADWSAAGSLATARYDHTATLLPSGKVLAAGGDRPIPLASAAIYDPATNAWSAADSLATARTDHTATLLPTGSVLIAGDASIAALSRARSFTPSRHRSPRSSNGSSRTSATPTPPTSVTRTATASSTSPNTR